MERAKQVTMTELNAIIGVNDDSLRWVSFFTHNNLNNLAVRLSSLAFGYLILLFFLYGGIDTHTQCAATAAGRPAAAAG